jgi:hypothetical protein
MKRCCVLVVLTFLLCALGGVTALASKGPCDTCRRGGRCQYRSCPGPSVRRDSSSSSPAPDTRSRYYSPVPTAAEQDAARQDTARREALKRLVAGTGTSADRELVGRWKNERRGDSVITALHLYRVSATDAGLEHLQGLTQLQTLDLSHAPVTDAGLEHLKGLTQLRVLCLSGTRVTDAGLEHLKGLTQLQRLYLSRTRVTDAGLEYLKGLTQLQRLDLTWTRVTEAGVAELKKTLPNVYIIR